MFKMKKLLSMALVVGMISSMSINAFASEAPKLTEEEVMAQVANNTATVTHDVRPLNSFTTEEINENPELRQIFDELNLAEPYTINKGTAYGDLYTTIIVTDGGQTVTYRSFPKVTFRVTDVGTAGSADIYSSFEVIESVNVDGDLNSGWNNAIRYKNVTGAMGCGDNTAFTNDITLSGNSAGVWSTDVKGIISMLIDAAGFGTVNEILGALDLISYSGGSSSSRDISNDNVRAVGSELDGEEFFSDDHDATIQSSMSTIDSSETLNETTTAVAEWKFDVYYFVGSLWPEYDNESVSCDVDYLVNVRG